MSASMIQIRDFIQSTFAQAGKKEAVIAVSGGIDSALALTLAVQTLGAEHVTALLLPYGQQGMADARLICEWNHVLADRVREFDIQPAVDVLAQTLQLPAQESFRLGNIMARVRMILLFDVAKELHALVVGTENKSEHYLGYFTRFGDGASDIEPLLTLTKTEVRALAEELGIPEQLIAKAPSAGLWAGQTDEQELGFSYELADQVIGQYIDQGLSRDQLDAPGVSKAEIYRVCQRIDSQRFKQEVPYSLSSS